MSTGAGRAHAPLDVPRWVPPLDALLREAIRRAPLLSFATPTNFAVEVQRLEEGFERGEALEPSFAYRAPPAGVADLAALVGVAVGALPSGDPLARVYARRALQVCGDLHWARDLQTGATSATGAQRYPRRDVFDDRADDLAGAWVRESHDVVLPSAASIASMTPYRQIPRDRDSDGAADADIVTDDAADPRSLLSRLREEIGARRLPARVIVVRGIAPLAATGDGVVQVAAGRRVTRADVERTVLHEIEGHLVPACVAHDKRIGIFVLGTAHGSDDQEGRAVAIERRHGHLGASRKRTLGLRHIAARAAHEGWDFISLARDLASRGAASKEAVRLAARALRGRGLGREAVYIPGLLRVEDAVARDPAIDTILASGRVGVDDAPVLADWL